MVYLITQWLISVLVVRLSGVETAGILTLAMSVNNVFYSIAMQGIRNYQVSDMKRNMHLRAPCVSSRLIHLYPFIPGLRRLCTDCRIQLRIESVYRCILSV